MVSRYRKSHLFGEVDRQQFVAGDELFDMAEVGGVKLAMMICYDVEFPEAVRAAALGGAHLIAVPTAQMEPFAFVAEEVVRVRAWENQRGTGLVYAVVDPLRVESQQRANPYLADRRPGLYSDPGQEQPG